MLSSERKLKIIEQLNQKNSVTVSELTAAFNVSIETIRRDLEALENDGLLKRVYGGAVTVKRMKSYENISKRKSENLLEKQKLAEYAAAAVTSGDLIALDCGTTAVALARCLIGRFDSLTVITNSLSVFNILSQQTAYKMILTGGTFLPEEEAFCGYLTLDMLKQLHTGKCFITPSAVSLKFGISDFVEELIPIQKQLIEISDKVFVLADSTKIETAAPFQIAPVNPAYFYMTDEHLSEDIQSLYHQRHIHIGTTYAEKK